MLVHGLKEYMFENFNTSKYVNIFFLLLTLVQRPRWKAKSFARGITKKFDEPAAKYDL